MVKKPKKQKMFVGFNVEHSFINNIDEFISKHSSKYLNRTQFIILAMEEKLRKEENEK